MPYVRFTRAWGPYPKGRVIQPSGVLADQFVKIFRVAEFVDPSAIDGPVEGETFIETATPPNVENTARRKGRRRHG